MDTDQSGSDRSLNPQLFGKDSDSSDDEGQAFYAGGSSTSGQQILGPPKKKGADLVKEMFKKAREAGAEAVEGGSSSGARGGANSKAFQGTAFKLGSDSTSSEVLPGMDPVLSDPFRASFLRHLLV